MPPLLCFDHVAFAYSNGTKLWNDLSFEVNSGEFVRITGASGAGKSTVLRLCVGLETASSGDIRLEGTSLSRWNIFELRHRVSYLPQLPMTLDGTVRENLLLPWTFAANRSLTPPTGEAMREGLDKLNLNDTSLDTSALSLSVGQKQRVCFLRTLLVKPDVLLLDEPESALDPENREIIQRSAADFNRGGGTVLWVSHNDFHPSLKYRQLEISKGKAAFLS